LKELCTRGSSERASPWDDDDDTVVQRYFGNRQVSSPCHFHRSGLGFRPVFLIVTDVSERSSLTFVWLHALGHLTCAYVWL
jgi:hypothetical protein